MMRGWRCKASSSTYETGELVEFSTYMAYGAAENDHRPGRWDNFREPYKFSGKEEDIEVGLQYFGARFYSPYLGVWLSPDPVTIHDLGSDPNPYSYVGGRPVMAVDPDGRAVFTLGGLAIAAVIGAVVGAATSIVVQAASNDWDFTKVEWGIKGVLGQALVGAVTSAVSFGVGSAVSAAANVTSELANVAIGAAVGASMAGTNYGIGAAVNGTSATAAGFLSAVAGGAVGGGIGGAGCGFGNALAAAGGGASASFLTSASITGDWSAKGFALSVGSAVAAAAASSGLGMLCFVRGTRVTKADGSQEPIEDIELGDRVLPSSAACDALDVSGWQRFYFTVDGDDHNPADTLDVELLRPEGWMPDLVVGGEMWLDLDELGIHGWGRLQAVTETDVQPRGVGCPVTGNFSGRNSGVMTLFLDGVQKPLELTEGHRLFSATRGDWVPAVELQIGEELETLDGVVAVAGRVVESARVERVFNLEVADVHAYHVGGVGVLAHNQNQCTRDQNKSIGPVEETMSGGAPENPNTSTPQQRSGVIAVFNIGDKSLTVTNYDTGDTVTVFAHSGDNPLPGTSSKGPIPTGEWDVLEYNGSDTRFRLDAVDANLGNDVHDPSGRDLFRLHKGTFTDGCANVPDASDWAAVRDVVTSGVRSSVPENRAPSGLLWEILGINRNQSHVTKYGTMVVQ